ncbi:hypothetical protein ACJ8S7_005067 [Klebsiella pneumoniae]|nr:hypothetical protein [Klebsiella pneumoniae]
MNYTQLVAAATAYADRNDIEVNNNIDNFFIMAEARINRALKTAGQTHRVYTNTINGKEYYTLPPEYNGMRVVHFNTGQVDKSGSQPIQLYYTTPENIVNLQELGDVDKQYYTIVNNQLQLHQTLPGGGTIEMVFYRKVPPLSQTNQENWLSQDAPDIYLSGLCAEIELFVKNYDAATLWDSRMSRAVDELSGNDVQNRWAGNSLVIRNA